MYAWGDNSLPLHMIQVALQRRGTKRSEAGSWRQTWPKLANKHQTNPKTCTFCSDRGTNSCSKGRNVDGWLSVVVLFDNPPHTVNPHVALRYPLRNNKISSPTPPLNFSVDTRGRRQKHISIQVCKDPMHCCSPVPGATISYVWWKPFTKGAHELPRKIGVMWCSTRNIVRAYAPYWHWIDLKGVRSEKTQEGVSGSQSRFQATKMT